MLAGMFLVVLLQYSNSPWILAHQSLNETVFIIVHY